MLTGKRNGKMGRAKKLPLVSRGAQLEHAIETLWGGGGGGNGDGRSGVEPVERSAVGGKDKAGRGGPGQELRRILDLVRAAGVGVPPYVKGAQSGHGLKVERQEGDRK